MIFNYVFKKRLFNKTKKIQLTAEEKSAVRDNLLKFMDANPVRINEDARLTPHPMHQIFLKPVTAVAAVVVMAAGGTSFAADFSLPGDILYPMKVNVNEKIEGWFAVSAESEANLALKLAEKRLEEAEKLAIEGKLSADASAELESRFSSHMSEAYDDLAALRGDEEVESAALISSEIDAKLKVHAKILTKISESQNDSGKLELDLFIGKLQGKIKDSEGNKKSEAELEAIVQGKLEALGISSPIEVKIGIDEDDDKDKEDKEDKKEKDEDRKDEASLETELEIKL